MTTEEIAAQIEKLKGQGVDVGEEQIEDQIVSTDVHKKGKSDSSLFINTFLDKPDHLLDQRPKQTE